MKYKVFRIGFGYAERESHTTISFSHSEGFNTPEEGLKHLVNTALEVIKTFRIPAVEESNECPQCELGSIDKSWKYCPRCSCMLFQEKSSPESFLLKFFAEFFTSTNDTQEHEEWEMLDAYGWGIGEYTEDQTFLLTDVECFDTCLGLDWGYPSYCVYEVTKIRKQEYVKLNSKEFLTNAD